MTWTYRSALLCLTALVVVYSVETTEFYGQNGEVHATSKYLIKDPQNTALTWEDAQLHCIEWGGSLANITSAQEDNFIKYILVQAYGRIMPRSFWIWTNGLKESEIQMLAQSNTEQSSHSLSNAMCYFYALDSMPVPYPLENPGLQSTTDCTFRTGYICQKFSLSLDVPLEVL